MPRKSVTRKALSLILSIVLIILPFSITSFAVAYPVIGQTTSEAQIWSLPGTYGHETTANKNQSKKLDVLAAGTNFRISDDEKDGDGDLWYKILYGADSAKEGYVYSGRVKLIANYVEDPDFESWLTKEQFPESYKSNLRILHTLYPNWIFYADHTNLIFSDAVAAQSVLGKKLVSDSRDDSQKSMAEGAYNWEEGKWKGFDGASWVAVDSRVVAYYMDPRNFLDTSNIFMFCSHQSCDSEKITLEGIQNAVAGTFMAGKLPDNAEKTYAQALYDTAKEISINPYVMISIIKQEQGVNGTGKSISGNYGGFTGLYNYFNIGAYASKSLGYDAVQRGLWWANGEGENKTSYFRPWTTHELAIRGGAKYYAVNYIEVGQNTLFYKNFNVYNNTTYSLHTHQYATNIEDSKNEGLTLKNSYYNVLDSEVISFNIPVYKNMPGITELPKAGTNNNCYLSNITVKDFTLESFYRYKNDYELVVPYTTQSIEVTATADPSAKVTGTGSKNLNVGENVMEISVTSSSGLKNKYTLTVFREEGDIVVPTPEITGDFNIDTNNHISKIKPETPINDFIASLGLKNGTVKIMNSSASEKVDGLISTGDFVWVYDANNQPKFNYKVVIYGDVNGDGKITSRDLLTLQRHILEKEKISGAFLSAGDANKDTNVSSRDLLVIQRHILEIEKLKQ